MADAVGMLLKLMKPLEQAGRDTRQVLKQKENIHCPEGHVQ